MGQARIPTLAVTKATRTATTDDGKQLTVTLYHLDRYNDPSQRVYWIEHTLRPAADAPADWRHTRQYTGKTARARVAEEWVEIALAMDEQNAKQQA